MYTPFGQAIVLVKRVKTGTDEFGDAVYTDTTTTVLGGFSPGGSVEANDQTVTQPTVYLPAGTDVAWLDAVQVGATTYEVDGSPNEWIHPLTGWHAGIAVQLKTAYRPPA